MNRKRVITFLLLLILVQTTSIIHSFNFTNKNTDILNDKLPLKTANQFEYYEINGTLDDATSIQVELTDLSWNITDIQLNFTNISQHRQLRTIEGNLSEVSFKDIYYSKSKDWRDYFGQHINFSEPTEVYGVYIYGFKTFQAIETVEVFFTDFDDGNQFPGFNDIYPSGPRPKINISTNPGWYYQDFSSSSLIFDNDDYYFIIDGYDVWSGYPNYYFGYNKKNPVYPLLWEWERNYDDDEIIYQGEPFMFKMLQKVNKTYFPKEIEMQALVDESYYNIINGTQSGDGNLSLTFLDFKPDHIFFNIPIKINDSSLELIYNVSYYIKLRKPVSVIIVELGGSSDGGKDSKVSTGIAPEFFFIVISLIILSFIGALTSYQTVRRIRKKKKRYSKKIFNKYMDVLNLNYVMISEKVSGLNIYDQMISGKDLDPTLLSGFLQAISSFGIELTGSEEQSQTIKLEFQKSKILMSEFKNYRIINIFEDNPSNDFMDSLDPLSHDLDKQYGKLIKNFDGETTQFEGIKALLEKHLQISLVYPLKVVITDNTKLKGEEKTLVNQALNYMKKRNSEYFYISYLMSEGDFNPKRAEKILGLIERKIFQPVI